MTDVFGATVTAGAFVVQFLEACAEFSSDARSLKTRLEWDLKALRKAQDSLENIIDGREDGFKDLQPEHRDLVEVTSEYLESLVGKVNKSLHRIKRQGWIHTGINIGTWVARRSQLKDMQKEVHEWTERLNVRFLSLPDKLRDPTTLNEDGTHSSAVIRSGSRLQEFWILSSNAKLSRSRKILMDGPRQLHSEYRGMDDTSSLPGESIGRQVIFAYRKVRDEIVPETPGFETLSSEMGELAAVLNCLDPAIDVRLLKVEYYFYQPESRSFIFAQTLPYTSTTMTLHEFMSHDAFPDTSTALNVRLKIAYKITEAMFFLHTAGFCHKNITSNSVVILRRFNALRGTEEIPSTTDEAYLMGYDLIRGTEARTYSEGVSDRRHHHSLRSEDRMLDIYQHPVRLQGKDSLRYNKQHDIYSMGVVLLEVGLWQQLPRLIGNIDQDPWLWPGLLSRIANGMKPIVGERYQRVVQWCLGLPGDQIVKNVDIMQEVLNPLEEIMNALS